MRYEDSWRLQDKATLALWRGAGGEAASVNALGYSV